MCWSRGNKVLTTSTTASTTKMCNMKNFYNLILRTCLLPVVFHRIHTLSSHPLPPLVQICECVWVGWSHSLKSNLNSIHLTTHAHTHTHWAMHTYSGKFTALLNLLFSFLEQMLFMCHMRWYKVRYDACSFFRTVHSHITPRSQLTSQTQPSFHRELLRKKRG